MSILWQLFLESRFPDLTLGITATDVDARLISRAENGCYGAGSLKEVPKVWLDSAFEQSEEQYRLRSQFRTGIQFRVQDIRVDFPDGPFHFIFCRNLVFTYFSEELQQQLLENMIATPRPDGVLIVGKHEVLPVCMGALFSCGGNLGVYLLS